MIFTVLFLRKQILIFIVYSVMDAMNRTTVKSRGVHRSTIQFSIICGVLLTETCYYSIVLFVRWLCFLKHQVVDLSCQIGYIKGARKEPFLCLHYAFSQIKIEKIIIRILEDPIFWYFSYQKCRILKNSDQNFLKDDFGIRFDL